MFAPFILPFYVYKDIVYFLKINCFAENTGGTEINNIKNEEMKMKVEQYSNVHEVMKGIYIEMNRKKSK